MKATALITAAALAFGTAAFAQQDKTTHSGDTARAEQHDGRTAGQKLRDSMHRLGEKTRHAFHRAGDKTRQTARRDDRSDTRAMGAPGSSRDADTARRQRMDEAYAHWQDRQQKNR